MKHIKRSRLLAIGSLILATSVSLSFGLFSLKANMADAATEKLSPVGLFSEDSGLTSKSVGSYNGLGLNTKTHAATFEGVINGDLEITYTTASRGGYGAYSFDFYDKDNPEEKVFSIGRNYTKGDVGTITYTDWTQETPTQTMVGKKTLTATPDNPFTWGGAKDFSTIADNSASFFPGMAAGFDMEGVLKLVWEGDTVTIKATKGKIESGTVILDEELATVGSLTIENFSDGYLMKVADDNASHIFHQQIKRAPHTDVVLLSINGIDLGAEELEVVMGNNQIVHSKEYAEKGKATIDCIQGEALEFSLIGTFNVNGISFTVPGKTVMSDIDTTSLLGKEEVVVQIDDSEKTYVLNVRPGYQTKDVFTATSNATNVTVAEAKRSGVKVVPQTAQATIDGVFSGDLSLEYVYDRCSYGVVKFEFFDKDDLTTPAFCVYRTYGIHDPNASVLYTLWGTASVGYNGKYYAMNTAYDSQADASQATLAAGLCFYPTNNCGSSTAKPNRGDKWATPGEIVLEWTENQVAIKVSVGNVEENKAEVTGLETLTTLTLDNFKDGYVVKISDADEAAPNGAAGCADGIVLLSINGTELANTYNGFEYSIDEVTYTPFEEYVQGEPIYVAQNGKIRGTAAIKTSICYADGLVKEIVDFDSETEKNIEWEAAIDLTTIGEKTLTIKPKLFGFEGAEKSYTVIVEESAQVTYTDIDGSLVSFYYSMHDNKFELPVLEKANWKFGGWYVNDELFAGLEQMDTIQDITISPHWYDDVAPEITLVDEESSILRITNEITTLGVQPSDVTVYDRATAHQFTDSEIIISIKAPNADDYVAFNAFTFNKDLFGAYIIRYTATDNWLEMGDVVNNVAHSENNSAYLERIIYYSAKNPTISVLGEVVEEGYVGKEIVLPEATAMWGATELPVKLTVSMTDSEGKVQEVTVKNNRFTPNQAGRYTVVYYAEDTFGQTTYEEYVITVKKDTTAPVIEVEFNVTELKVGDVLTLPTATASDEVDNAPTISVAVYYNGEVVATGDVTVENEGVYTVVYKSVDYAGNIQVVQFDVLVVEENTGFNWGLLGCQSSIGGFGIEVMTLLGAAALIFFDKKRKVK